VTDRDENRVARVRDVFDDWALRGRATAMAESHAPVARRAVDALGLTRTAWFLDIGCGNGYAVRWAAEAAPDGCATGLDVAPEMIALARRLSVKHANAEFIVARFPEHDLPPARFDAIFSMEVFYYLPDLDAALTETVRLLRPGGRFACAVDYYGENTASHGWPADLGVEMTLLDAAGWRDAFRRAGFADVSQERIRIPAADPRDAWKEAEGSLMTMGVRP
jgi:SAM-dependent methyltransferase